MIFHVVYAALFALFLALYLTVRTVDSRVFHCLSIAGSTAGLIATLVSVSIVSLTVFTAILFALLMAVTTIFPAAVEQKVRLPYLVIPFAMLAVWGLIEALYGDFDVRAILYHLRFGFASGGLPYEHVRIIALFAAFAILLIASWTALLRKNAVLYGIDRIAFLPLILVNPLTLSVVDAAGLSLVHPVDLAAFYEQPSDIPADRDRRPNLIHIYLESGELTFGDRATFGNVLDPLRPYMERGFVATGIDQIDSTGWTIAGQVASKCGVPLITPWLQLRGIYEGGDGFLPNVACLSDRLSKRGYHVEFAGGANLNFAGTRAFLETHHFDSVTGKAALMPLYPEGANEWGVNDDAVFDWALRRIAALAVSGQPYSFTLPTLGGHGPVGILSAPCLDGRLPIEAREGVLRGIECANRLAARFIGQLEAAGLLNNTIVVVQSDHLAMGNDVSAQLAALRRRNLFVAFGPRVPHMETNRPAAMIDVYPTLLEMMGFRPEGGKAGLGVSLLGTAPTLVQRFGVEALDHAIRRDRRLRTLFWETRDPPASG